MTLTGCLHHKHKKEKLHKSRPVQVEPRPIMQPPVVVRLPKEVPVPVEEPKKIEPKVEAQPQILPGERPEEKKSDSWWFW